MKSFCRLTLLLFSFITMACNRATDGESAKVKLSLPSFPVTQSQAINPQSGSDTWGVADPTSLNDIGCFGVMIGGPEPEMSGSYCANSAGQEIARFSVIGGLVVSGKNIEVTVPSGSNRKFYLIGFRTANGICDTVVENELNKSNYSNPFVIGTTTADLIPGDNNVAITAIGSFTAANKIEHCTFLKAPTPGGGGGSLAINRSQKTLALLATYMFTATGGTSPYSFSIQSGIGSINSSGLYMAAAVSGTAVIQVTDSAGAVAVASVDIVNPGTLDSTFGVGGILSINLSYDQMSYATAIQPDGKIVSVGSCYDGLYQDWCATRLNPDGTIDTSFASSGHWYYDTGSDNAMARSVRIQADGKIVIAGQCLWNPSRACIARLNSDGSMDTTFNGNGFLIDDQTGASYNSRLKDAYIQPDGKIVGIGMYDSAGTLSWDYTVARYNTDGSRDTSFDSDGLAVIDTGSSDDYTSSGHLAASGKIYLVGTTAGSVNGIVVRLNSNGSLDTTFDSDGIYTFPGGGGYITINSVREQSDGKIIIVGEKDNSQVLTARLTSTGALDSTFGVGGIQILDPLPGDQTLATDVQIQPDDRILIAGYEKTAYIKTWVIRLTSSNGTYDTSFNTTGVFYTTGTVPSNDQVRMSLTPKGDIIWSGKYFNGGSNDLSYVKLKSDSN